MPSSQTTRENYKTFSISLHGRKWCFTSPGDSQCFTGIPSKCSESSPVFQQCSKDHLQGLYMAAFWTNQQKGLVYEIHCQDHVCFAWNSDEILHDQDVKVSVEFEGSKMAQLARPTGRST